jgi:hypothetical protein
MDPGNVAGDGELDRVRDLCAGLGGTLVGGDLLAWAVPGDVSDVPEAVFRVVSDAGLLADGDPWRPVSLPADAAALMDQLWEVEEPAAISVLTSLAASAPQRRQRRVRRRYPDDPQDVFEEMARLTGPGSRWWTNTDLTRWNPITQHTFDAVVVCAGNGVIVTVIGFEGGD